MKKIKIPKFKIRKINLKGFLNYLLLLFLTFFILLTTLIALPLTETISSNTTYDLRTKNDLYWAKEYTLELVKAQPSDVEKVKSILFRRLEKLGVEKVSMYSFSENDKEYITVQVQTSIAQIHVEEMIRSIFQVRVVTRNPEIDFENPETPYVIYFEDSYLPTEFTRESFRNVYITNLKNASNEYSYFALFKAWPWNTQWNEFLSNNKGVEMGVSIDGFVTPVTVPSTEPILFAVSISTSETREAELISILYNSGVMPVSYSITEQREIPLENTEVDYIKLILGVMIATVVIYAYLLFIEKINKRILLTCALTTLITISTWIAYLKIASIPVDISLLAIEILVMIALLRMTVENTESKIIVNILLVLVAALTILFGSGYVRIFASNLFILLIIGYISEMMARVYIDKVRKLLR